MLVLAEHRKKGYERSVNQIKIKQLKWDFKKVSKYNIC